MAQTDATVTIGSHGRLVIPAGIHKHFGFKPGDTLLVRVHGESLVLEKRETVLARAKGWFDDVPPEVSLVDELLADRRQEAEGEDKE